MMKMIIQDDAPGSEMTPSKVNSQIAEVLASTRLDEVSLRMTKFADAPFILSLRNDPNLAAHLSPTSPNLDSQQLWMSKYEERNSHGLEHYFIIQHRDVAIGTIRLYDYDFTNASFCCGSWLIKRGAPHICAPLSLILAYDIGFRTAGFSAMRFDVRKDNLSVLSFHRRVGAQEVSHDGPDVHFRVEREAYEKVVRPKLLSLHARVS